MRYRNGLWILIVAAALLLPGVAHADYLSDARVALQKGDLKTAQLQLRNAVRTDPQNAEAHYLLAEVHLELGDAVAAQKEAQAALDRGYDPHLAVPILTRSYLAQRKFKELLQDFKVQNKDKQTDASILLARGFAQTGLGQLDEAKQSFADAEKMAPDFPQPLLVGARLALARGDMATAQEKIDRVLKLDPKSVDGQLIEAQLLRSKNDAAGALALLDKVITEQPGSIQGLLDRASLQISLGKDDKAKEDIDKILSVRPADIQATYLRALLFARAKNFQAADDLLEKLTPAMVQLPRAYFLQAVVKENLGQLEQALTAIGRHLARSPDDIDAHKLFARINLQKRAPNAAIDDLNKVVAGGHADAEIFDLLGQAQTMAGRQDLAADSFRRAQTLAPDNVGVNTRLAGALLGSGDTDAAVLDLERSLRLAPKDTGVGEALFYAALSTGDMEKAQAAIDKIRVAQGDTASAGNLEGVLMMMQLDLDGAHAKFQAVADQFPAFTLAKVNLARVAAMQGHADEADKVLNDLLVAYPTSEPALSIYASSNVAAGKPAAAIAALERAHEKAPDAAQITAGLADLYIRTNEPKKALALATVAPKAGQSTAPVLLDARARAQLALGQQKDARDSYTELLGQDPTNLNVRRALIGLLVAMGDIESARNVLQAGVALSPRNLQLFQDMVGIDYKVGGIDAALATADRLALQDRDFVAARALRGDVFMAAKRWDDAAGAYRNAMKDVSNPPTMLITRLVGALNAGGKPDEATQALKDWITTHPDDLGAIQLLTGLDINAKRYADAEVGLNKILAKRPHDAVTLNNLAWVLQQSGNSDAKARAMAQQAYILAPGAQTADTLGWILVSQGEAAKGLPLLRQANTEGGSDPRVKYHFAVALKDVGQKAEAVKQLNAVIAVDGDFDEKADARKLLGELTKGS
jgi:putative PEP-CTERM system TPR-repeat lipoprotein